MSIGKTVLILALGLAPMLFVSTPGLAGSYVTAYSNYGNGRVSAPVREAQFGYQVKLPGGSWHYCEHNSLFFGRNRPCSETLRRETLDYWETQSEEQGGRGR